jgi:TPP-dependent pyruvate/acetoin dehydrogenase alpha subunit
VPDISARAAGYGVPGVVVDGSDPAAVYEVMQNAVERARAGHGPTPVEAKVTRLQGHYVADQQTYRPDAATVAATKDPLPKLQQTLLNAGILTDALITQKSKPMCSDRSGDEAVATMRAALLALRSRYFKTLYA